MGFMYHFIKKKGPEAKRTVPFASVPFAFLRLYQYNPAIALAFSFIFCFKLSGDNIFTLSPNIDNHPRNVFEAITSTIIQKQFPSLFCIITSFPKRSITTFIRELSNCSFTLSIFPLYILKILLEYSAILKLLNSSVNFLFSSIISMLFIRSTLKLLISLYLL